MAISEKKLNRNFIPFNTLELSYVIKARELAKDFKLGKEIDMEQLRDIRIEACEDRNHLKGDFVISLFLEMDEHKKRWEEGKRIHIAERLIENIFENYFSKQKSVTDFCLEKRITRSKYYRVVNCDVKYHKDKEQLEKIKKRVRQQVEKNYE